MPRCKAKATCAPRGRPSGRSGWRTYRGHRGLSGRAQQGREPRGSSAAARQRGFVMIDFRDEEHLTCLEILKGTSAANACLPALSLRDTLGRPPGARSPWRSPEAGGLKPASPAAPRRATPQLIHEIWFGLRRLRCRRPRARGLAGQAQRMANRCRNLSAPKPRCPAPPEVWSR